MSRLYQLRYQLLRAPWGQPEGSERDESDAAAFHLIAVTAEGDLIGTGRLHEAEPGVGQIRYMAVLPGFQGQGVGAAILAGLEAEARVRGYSELILNAREEIADFYRRQNYQDAGAGPTMFGTIRHCFMRKSLRSAIG